MASKKSKKKQEWHIALREAIDEAGSLSALGRLCGCKHNTILMALRGVNISAELAAKVSDVTSVPRHRFRPDLWPDPNPQHNDKA